MKVLLQKSARSNTSWLKLTCLALVLVFAGCKKDHDPTLTITTVATGLVTPIGIEADKYGNIWVCETGTAHNDGKVIVIKKNGTKYDAIVNLSSFVAEISGEIHGPAHLLLDGHMLYILAGDYLYKADISGFKPGDTPLDATTIPYEDIASFVLAYPFVNNAHDTHPYNLTKGPDGDLYIADAGANAIIHRKSAGVYSVLAEVPGFANPTPVGPPQVQAVPTSIMYDGHNFLVTTLTGFPFPSGKARIYKISMSGAVSLYQDGFTTLVDIAEGNYGGRLVVQHAIFGPMGFTPNTGSLVWANGTTSTELAGGLNLPIGIKQLNHYTWYVTSIGDGTVLKVTYK